MVPAGSHTSALMGCREDPSSLRIKDLAPARGFGANRRTLGSETYGIPRRDPQERAQRSTNSLQRYGHSCEPLVQLALSGERDLSSWRHRSRFIPSVCSRPEQHCVTRRVDFELNVGSGYSKDDGRLSVQERGAIRIPEWRSRVCPPPNGDGATRCGTPRIDESETRALVQRRPRSHRTKLPSG